MHHQLDQTNNKYVSQLYTNQEQESRTVTSHYNHTSEKNADICQTLCDKIQDFAEDCLVNSNFYQFEQLFQSTEIETVSYTHLTLPTKA